MAIEEIESLQKIKSHDFNEICSDNPFRFKVYRLEDGYVGDEEPAGYSFNQISSTTSYLYLVHYSTVNKKKLKLTFRKLKHGQRDATMCSI